jgi:hypothetical protein
VKTLSLQLKRLNKALAVVGLKYITEFITEYDDGKSIHFYRCNLCESSGEAPVIMKHILDYNHRIKYIQEFGLDPPATKSEMEKKAGAIEQVHGQGKWKIEKEKKTFVTPAQMMRTLRGTDKESTRRGPPPKDCGLAEWNWHKAANTRDVEMKEEPKAGPSGRNGADSAKLRGGDVVVDEIGGEESFDAKLYVLGYLNDLVSQDFEITSETELGLVDGIITRMRTAVIKYQAMREADQLRADNLKISIESDVLDPNGQEVEAMEPENGDAAGEQNQTA